MNSGDGSKPYDSKRTVHMLDLDRLCSMARVQGLYSTPARREMDNTVSEYHICPFDQQHKIDVSCWCEPELVHEDECSKVYKHRRIQ